MNLNRKERIELLLNEQFNLELCDVINESFMHRVPENAETHFKVILVSSSFEGISRIARHKLVKQILSQEFRQGLHALSLSLYSPTEWQKNSDIIPSPKCAHQ